jgi:aminoglycoside phosphotransferase
VPQLLLVLEPDGWALPHVEGDEGRSADVVPLVRAARVRLGMEVSVLRCVRDVESCGRGPRQHVHELDVHAPDPDLPPRAGWFSRSRLPSVVLTRPDHRELLDTWFRDREGAGRATDGPAWQRPGWRAHALRWVDAALARAGRAPVDGIEQLRVWEFSQVLRLQTGQGDCYFKAVAASLTTEPRLTRWLAARFPAVLPTVIAIDPDRGWLLMEAARGPALMSVDQPSRWTEAAGACARIQIDCAPHVAELAGLGCPDRPLGWLSAQIGPLLEDRVAMQPLDADALSDAEVDEVRALGPELAEMCRGLDGLGVPASLEHGDLWADNVVAADTGCVLIDWEDASIAHPFFSPFLLLESLEHAPALARVADAREWIREAYLSPWRERLRDWPAGRLERAFALSQPLAAVHYAVQFRLALPRIETSREVRGFVPLFLRSLLRQRRSR